jgi:putative membrane protein
VIGYAHAHDAGGAAAVVTLDVVLVATLLIAGLLYASGTARLWRKAGTGHGVARAAAVSFALGWLVTAAALVDPLDGMASRLFAAHMVQHELLMAVAAPLIVLGRPLAVWSWALPAVARLWSRAWRRPTVRSVWLLVAGLPAAWLAHSAALWLWHVPAFFQAALANPVLHALEHISFLLTGTLFWAAALDRSRPQSVLYLFLFMLHSSVLGTLLALSPVAWYPSYGTSLDDQQLGGLIMWVPGSAVYALAALAMLLHHLRMNTAASACTTR